MSKSTTQPAADRAYDYVKGRIISGNYPDTTMLSEGEVAGSLGLSRTPVREAFLRLEVEGFLKLYPKRGALVLSLSDRDIREIFEARQLVETKCASNVCAFPDEDRAVVVQELRELLARQEEALAGLDLATFSEADAAFHHTVFRHAGNRILESLGASLREHQQRFTAITLRRSMDNSKRFMASHRALVDALEAGDAAAYARVLEEHLHDAQGMG